MNLDDISGRGPGRQPSYGNQPNFGRGTSGFQRELNSGLLPIQRPETPRKTPAPLPPIPAPPEPEYYSGDEGDSVVELESLTENPEGPWSCEHCTFINPKSMRVCTVCCKTPVKGYRLIPSRPLFLPPSPVGKRRAGVGKGDVEEEGFGGHEFTSPVVQSKLSFSTAKSQQSPQKISLSVEKVRKPRPAPVVVEYESESGSGSGSESDPSSDDPITEKHRSLVRESKSNTLKMGKGEGKGREAPELSRFRCSQTL